MTTTKTTIPLTEARRRLFEITDEVQKPGVAYTFTERGKPKAIMMSAEEHDSLMETLEIMGDPEVQKRIAQAEQELKQGEYVTWEDLKQQLGWTPQGVSVLADRGTKAYRATPKRKAR